MIFLFVGDAMQNYIRRIVNLMPIVAGLLLIKKLLEQLLGCEIPMELE